MSHTKMNKKGAIELSIGTVVIIVLAMTMLILGLVLVRNIFTGATENVDTLNEKVKNEIVNLFATGDSNVVVKLGADKTARVKQGSGPFRIAIGARKPDTAIDRTIRGRDEIQYKLTLDESSGNCAAQALYGKQNTAKFFTGGIEQFKQFDTFEGSQAFALVEVNIPDGSPLCSQKVYVDVAERSSLNTNYAGSFFIIQIEKKGFF